VSSPIVEQLLEGVKVRCADGFEIVCRPLPLKAAMRIEELWQTVSNTRKKEVPGKNGDPPKLVDVVSVEERGAARLAIAKLFLAAYPDLGEHISPGDVDVLVPDFFWGRTGASVVRPTAPSTGTSSGTPTAPTGAGSPNPT
jgi:hypothetical protein